MDESIQLPINIQRYVHHNNNSSGNRKLQEEESKPYMAARALPLIAKDDLPMSSSMFNASLALAWVLMGSRLG